MRESNPGRSGRKPTVHEVTINAMCVQVLEKLYKEGWSKEFGVGAIILSPTAELAKQTYDVFNKVGRYHSFSIALVIGGGNVSLSLSFYIFIWLSP
ncbi:DBP4 [Cordylochernes scorpioides]|uniref:DBP4 n=1 Tax=Cordylochernes scorpioides TaxID=51811 RepID=A0ABY6LE00_9ARAC|nr:DBP4 [Cordylochernes scorpioides]